MPPESDMPDLFIVDGSNLATEGRDKPSLEQLNECLDAFREEFPNTNLTVVCDATFGHRIAKQEVKAFDRSVASNEIVTPPAGAVGRGDAFILAIANKAGAGVLSNDSFQEFHGEYGWLFEHGRLIGGKPVPHVGWVFVDRNPVRGPKSRQAVQAARRSKKAAAASAEEINEAKDRANRRVSKKRAAEPADTDEPVDEAVAEVSDPAPASAPASGSGGAGHVNDVVAFLEFVERHPVGTRIRGVVDSYSSHGAYARVDDVLVYIPLRLMGTPAPTSARKVLSLGDEVEAVVAGYVPDRRSVDAALPAMATEIGTGDGDAAAPAPPKRRRRSKRSASTSASTGTSSTATASSGTTTTGAAKPAVKRAAPKKAAAKRSAATKASAAKRTSTKRAAATKRTPAKKAAAKKSAATKTPAKKSAAKKSAAKKSAAKKSPAKRTAAKKSTASKRTAAKQPAAQASARRRSGGSS